MSKFISYTPKGFLKNVLNGIIYIEGVGTGIALQRRYQNIVINMGSNFYTSDPYSAEAGKENKSLVWINGQHERAFALENPGEPKMYVIAIKPGMLAYFSKAPVIETNGRALGAADWAEPDIFDLRDSLLGCNDVTNGFHLIERYFTDKLSGQDLGAVPKIEYLNRAMPHSTVEEICTTLGYTRKKLRAEAIRYFGAPVKNMQGIIRFNDHLGTIANNVHDSLSSLHSYYDQAHFINDFKARTGLVPSQYRMLCQQYPMIQRTPNFIPIAKETFLQFIARYPV